ncbi:hypothetical protein [Candidatus Thiosymbion oneisti]|uniref:hypothetical protein n=1 Tax=Candidatus Thiosymbion oneisti TaxID=589554 RepID=UPI00105EB6A6|nr:hypothetical protein [Candidatus Thiosymbion oneisti]
MPSFELRVFDYDRLLEDAFLRQAEKIGIDWVNFGSESCYLQLPPRPLMEEIFSRLDGFKKKFSIPILYESHFDKVAELFGLVCDQADTISVNDFGALAYLETHFKNQIPSVSIGDVLFFSYAECPWHDHIIRDESERVRGNLLTGNFDNEWMDDFMERYPFRFEVEMPFLKTLQASASSLKKKGYAISLLPDILPVSFARACHSSRYWGLPVDECLRNCRQMVTLSPTHRWDFFEADVTEIRPVIKEQMPDYLVWGNSIFLRNREDDAGLLDDHIDKIILDMRFYKDLNQVAERIERLSDSQVKA